MVPTENRKVCHIVSFLLISSIWHTYLSKPKPKTFTRTLQACTNFTDMCAAFGYESEEHVLQTKDGYLLCLHRLCRQKGESYSAIGSNLRRKVKHKPVVYLHHGLLMNSEVWVCQIEEKLSLPFRLVEEGYDVWFGNNRGNKYSKKSLNHLASKAEFWNFSMVSFNLLSPWPLGWICVLWHSWFYRLHFAHNKS